jgi:hypothetical protein
MSVYRAVLVSVPADTKDAVVQVRTEPGQEHHVVKVLPPAGFTPAPEDLEELNALLTRGHAERDGAGLRLIFPVRRQE